MEVLKIKFQGTPNLLIRVNKNIQKTRNMKHFRFDKTGVYETDNPRLIKLLSRRFKVLEENNIIDESANEEAKVLRHCKKCDFVCENQGQLLQHYKNNHK